MSTSPMNLLHESYRRLFPGREFPYQAMLEYNRRLARFNANILYSKNRIQVHLNLEWKNIDDEIKIGLIQALLLKVFREKKYTPNIKLYHNFVKSLPLMSVEKLVDPLLEPSFRRVNAQFFDSGMQMPNLTWGKNAFRKLASYNFHSNTITISSIFKKAPKNILEYLIYHELLHKHVAFTYKNGRSSYHSKEFRAIERLYPRRVMAEKELQAFLRQQKRPFSRWKWW